MDHYELLEITREATPEQIRSAWRKKALEWHPDRRGGNTEKFKKIQEAFETISDPNKRAYYNSKHPPKSPPKPKEQKKYPHEERYGRKRRYKPPQMYSSGSPSHDIWGQKLSSEERKEWARLNNLSTRDIIEEKRTTRNDGWVDAYGNLYED